MSIFKDIIVHFAAAQFANLVAARAHFAIGKREGEVRRQHALQHCRIRTKEAFARITLKLENFLFGRALRQQALNSAKNQQHYGTRELHLSSS